jgi:hypothetical protein
VANALAYHGAKKITTVKDYMERVLVIATGIQIRIDNHGQPLLKINLPVQAFQILPSLK